MTYSHDAREKLERLEIKQRLERDLRGTREGLEREIRKMQERYYEDTKYGVTAYHSPTIES